MGVEDVVAATTRAYPSPEATIKGIQDAHVDAALAAVTVPFAVRDGVTVTAVSKVLDKRGYPLLRIDGEGGGISWPVFTNKPPVLVDDPNGNWVQRKVSRQGKVDVDLVPANERVTLPDVVVSERRLRDDPAEGIRLMVDGLGVR